MNTLEKKYKDALKSSDKIIVDLSDTAIKGNVAYGAFYIPLERLKKGKIKDSIGLFLNGARLYVDSHAKPSDDGREKENLVLDDLYRVLDKYQVTREEMEKATERYMRFKPFQRRGFSYCLRKLSRHGKPKETILFTKESSESADAAVKYLGFDRAVSNVTTYHPDNTINGIDFKMSTPEDRLSILEKEVDLKKCVMISNNKSDERVFSDKVKLFIPFARRTKNGELCISDFEKFAEQLDSD